MPRTTIAEVCRDRGIDRKDWDEAKRQGIDPWDRKAMKEWLAKLRKRIKPNASIPPTSPAAVATTIDEIKKELSESRDYDVVKILTEKLKGLQTAVKVQRETRELIPLSEVETRDVRIASVVKAGILKLCNDSAPMAEGLDAAAIHKVLIEQGTHVLEMMADEHSSFWKELTS